MNVYFNHCLLENASKEQVEEYLYEIIQFKDILMNEGSELCFYEEFWNIKLEKCTLMEYIFDIKNKDEVSSIIRVVMNGPYFYKNTLKCSDKLNIYPLINKTGFGNDLLNICFCDKVDKILSLKKENILNSLNYEISTIYKPHSFNVNNIKGVECLKEYFKKQYVIKSINEVFDNIERESKCIVILEDARKSSKKHDFKGTFQDIYEAIIALEKIELPLLIQGVNDERRKEEFKKLTQYEISKETYETLNIERYRKEREFIIPEKGKYVFNWHIKINKGNTRIHYYIDKTNKKIYIGHCGKHLGTASYKS